MRKNELITRFVECTISKLNERTYSLKKAALITAVSRYSVAILTLLFSAVLSRILHPADFGVVAIIAVFTNFFLLLGDMGIGTAVVQNKELSAEDEDRLFTFSIYLGCCLAIVFIFLSIFLDKLYKTSVYLQISPILATSLAFSIFNMVPNAKLMKNKQFIQSAIRAITISIVGNLFAILIASLGGKYYAIVIQSLVNSVIIFAWNVRVSKLRLNNCGIVVSLKKVWGYSSYQFAFSFVNYFSRNLDNLLAGYYFGDVQLSYYDKSYMLTRYAVNHLTDIITPAVQPILSDFQNDTSYILIQYRKLAKLLAIVSVFISCICFFASREIIILFFGSQWENAVLPFHYLSLSLAFQMVGGLSGSMFQSLNRTKEMFWSGIVGSIITIAGIAIGISLGNINSLALCCAIALIINFIKGQWFLSKFCFKVSVFSLLKMLLPEVVIGFAVSLGLSFVPTLSNIFISLLLKLGVGFVIYLVMLWITNEYKYLLALLPKSIQKNKAAD